MPLPLLPLASFGLSALGGAYQIGSGLVQANKANHLKQQDTRTDADREALAMARQAANSQRMPGMGQAIDNLNQSSANARSASVQAGTSAANVLSANSQIQRNQIQGLSQLNTQSAAYQDSAKRNLVGELRRDSALQQRDREAFERSKAALKQSANTNIFGGLSSIASAGVYGLGGGFNKDSSTGTSNFVQAQNYNNGISMGVGAGGNGYVPQGEYQMPLGVQGQRSSFGGLNKLNFKG